MGTYRDTLSPLLFRQFCTRFASTFMDGYKEVILSRRKISVVGAEQLLLDTNRLARPLSLHVYRYRGYYLIGSIRTMLLQLFHAGILSSSAADVAARAATPVPATYRAVMELKVHQLVTILKLVCCEEEQLEVSGITSAATADVLTTCTAPLAVCLAGRS